MNISYVFHGHFPDTRAAALFAAQEASSLLAQAEVTLLVPTRRRTNLTVARTQFNLPPQLKLKALWSLELLGVPLLKRIAFPVSLVTFSWSLFGHLKKIDIDWVVTVDHLPALAAAARGKRVLLQIHDFPSRWNPLWRLALRYATLVMATNNWKEKALQERFCLPAEKVFMERNGVTIAEPHNKQEARKKLGLSLKEYIVMYTGNLYPWKGVDTLAKAAPLLPEKDIYIVGGTEQLVTDFKKKYSTARNLHIIGHRPHNEISFWQSAADILVLPNSAKEEISTHYTSPMKLFEYMATGRPIVASDLPSIREILGENLGYVYAPDDSEALAEAIQKASSGADQKEQLFSAVAQYAWDSRARRLFARLTL